MIPRAKKFGSYPIRSRLLNRMILGGRILEMSGGTVKRKRKREKIREDHLEDEQEVDAGYILSCDVRGSIICCCLHRFSLDFYGGRRLYRRRCASSDAPAR